MSRMGRLGGVTILEGGHLQPTTMKSYVFMSKVSELRTMMRARSRVVGPLDNQGDIYIFGLEDY
jgi:hypothetical protein